jgi:hypothetical protein
MTLPALNGAVLVGGCAQFAQHRRTYASKTGQTGQTGQGIENAREFDAPPGQELTSPQLKLTGGTVHQAHSRARGAPRPTHHAQDTATERVPRR